MTAREPETHAGPTTPQPPTTEARYLARLDDMQSAATHLRDMLSQLIANCDDVRAQINDGQPALQVLQAVGDEKGMAFRKELHLSGRRFDRAMQATRGESFHIFITEGQRSITDVARAAGLSVQMFKRLIESVDEGSPPSGGAT
jgi:argininosuccinate lyase